MVNANLDIWARACAPVAAGTGKEVDAAPEPEQEPGLKDKTRVQRKFSEQQKEAHARTDAKLLESMRQTSRSLHLT